MILKKNRKFLKQLAEKQLPFDHIAFVKENLDLTLNYMRKDTTGVIIDEETQVIEEWQHQNNTSVLSANANRTFSNLEKLEWIKCSVDAIYFCEKYIKITSIDDGIVPFKMYDFQREMIRLFQNNLLSIACTGRQQGKTTTSGAFILWFAMFHGSKQCAVLANKADQAQEIMERIQTSYELLPVFMKAGVKIYNKRSTTFANNSKIFSGASSISAIRGKSISLLYWDEAAHTPNDIAFYESVFPTLSSGKKSRLIMTSTPNGARGLFHKIWIEHETNGFARIKVMWYEIPSRDEEWRRMMIAASSEEQFEQEHCCSFRGSQNTLLSAAALQAMVIHPPIQKKQNLKIYEEVNPEHNYVISVDVARGVGKDYSAFIVVDVSSKPFKVVATFRDNYIAPMRFPYIIESTAHHYNEAFVLVEINDIGGQVADTLYHELEYENTFMTHIDKRRITLGFGANATIGVRTTTSVKSIGITNIKTLLEEGHFEPRDEDIINEFGTFIPKGKSYEADKDCNDDMVMCCVLFGWMSTQAFFEDLINVSTRDILLSRWRDEMDNDFVPFGFVESEFGMFEGSSALDMDSEDNFWEGF